MKGVKEGVKEERDKGGELEMGCEEETVKTWGRDVGTVMKWDVGESVGLWVCIGSWVL